MVDFAVMDEMHLHAQGGIRRAMETQGWKYILGSYGNEDAEQPINATMTFVHPELNLKTTVTMNSEILDA